MIECWRKVSRAICKFCSALVMIVLLYVLHVCVFGSRGRDSGVHHTSGDHAG